MQMAKAGDTVRLHRLSQLVLCLASLYLSSLHWPPVSLWPTEGTSSVWGISSITCPQETESNATERGPEVQGEGFRRVFFFLSYSSLVVSVCVRRVSSLHLMQLYSQQIEERREKAI